MAAKGWDMQLAKSSAPGTHLLQLHCDYSGICQKSQSENNGDLQHLTTIVTQMATAVAVLVHYAVVLVMATCTALIMPH